METETKPDRSPWRSLKVRATVFTLVIFVLGIWAQSFYISRGLQTDMEQLLGEQQFSVVTSVAKKVNDDLTDRLDALETVAKEMGADLLARPTALQANLEQRPLLQLLFNGGVLVTGADGTSIADVPLSAGRIGTNYMDRDNVAVTLKEGKTAIGNPTMGKKLGAPVFSLAAPIIDGQGKVIGSLVGTINLGKPNFLDQITRSAYGKGGGYVLASAQHRLVITATDKSRIMAPLPAPGVNTWVDRFANGYEGWAVATNPKGVEVVVSGSTVPAAGWYVLATLPTEEAFAPLHDRRQRLLWATLLLTLLTGAVTWWVLKRQLAPLVETARALTKLAESTQIPQPLALTQKGEIGQLVDSFNRILQTWSRREAALQKSEQNLAITLNSIGDAVIATDTVGQITGMNPTAERLTGWPMADALGHSLNEVFRIVNAQTRLPSVNPVQLVMERGEVVGLANHTTLLARDGREYQIADSAAPIRNAAGQIVGVVLVFSDVSEKYAVQEALDQFFEQALHLHLIARLDGVIQRVNPGWEALLGYAKGEIEGSSFLALVHPDDQASTLAEMAKLGRGVTTFHLENRYRHKSGEFRLLAWSASVSSAKQLIYAVASDITERKRAEQQASDDHQALLSGEARHAAMFANISDVIAILDVNGLITYASTNIEANFGWKPGDLVGTDVWMTVHPDDLERVQHAFYALLQQDNASITVELLFRCKDGRHMPVEVTASNLKSDPLIGGVLLNFRDITARKQAQAALQQGKTMLERTESMAHLASFEWDVDTNTVSWSPEMYRIFGRDPALGIPDLQGQAELYTPESTQILFDAVDKAVAAGTPYELELMSVQPDGEQRPCWIKGFPDRDASGRVVRVAGLVQDITERKQAQAVDRFLAQASGGPDAEPFFDALARFLAQTLQMDYTCIDRLEGDALNATTLSVWHDGHFEDNLTYALRDTPCGEVVGRGVCCFPASVCQFFPNDAALQELRAESYIGVTLWSHAGQPIGLIAVIGRRALGNRAQAEATLARVAGRAAAELERLTTETAMRESEARFRSVVELMPDVIVVHRGGKLLHVNPAGIAMFGAQTEQDLIGKPILQFVHPDFHQIVLARVKRAVEYGEAAGTIEERYVRLDGTSFDAEVQSKPIVLAGQAAVLVTLRDITERKAAQEKLQLAAGVFTHALEGIMITTPEAAIIDVNNAFTRITGYTRDEVLGQNPRLLKSGRHDADYYAAMWRNLVQDGYWYGEVWNRRKNGDDFAEMQAISAVRDAQGTVSQYIALFSDITDRKAHESQLERIAHFDALTNLPNRVLLADRLQQAMAQAQRRQQQLAVVYLDLDGFKAINDHQGHQTGDQVLITLAQRMKDALREGDTMARMGGDEFVAVLIDLQDTSACVPLLNRLLAAAAEPVQAGASLQVSASLGVTFYPQTHDIDADQLLRQADQAMYQAKLAGKNRYHVFDAAQDSSLRSHHEGLERIRLALQNHEFVLHYQPKVNMHTGQVLGAEALIRWQHPEKGLLAPATFLPVIEDHPLAVDVGDWVIDAAMQQMERWHAAGLHLHVSVNIGARQLQQANFVERLQTILARHPQVHPGNIELEVLETSALADMAQVSQVIEDCNQIGVRFALDDFGTGYSSLTYLKRLRVALLKIDQSFVRDMLDDPDDLAILEGVIGLAAAFKRDVIAEGVETVAHGTALLQLGCALAQGYGIARPMPPEQMPAWVATWQPDAAWCAVPDSGETVRSN